MKSFLSLAAVALIAMTVQAGELDNSDQGGNVSSTESTIVVRVNTLTGEVEKAELQQSLAQDQAQELAQQASVQFEKIAQSQVKSELDQTAGSSSWYWYCPTYYSYPSYGYTYYNTGFYNYGYWYSNYYSYSYSNYNYYYYQPYYGYDYGYNNGWNYRNRHHNGGWR